MKKLLSLPPNLVSCFHDVTGLPANNYFCTNDPVGAKLGSGGGTTWLVNEARHADFIQKGERAILIHASGQSRRLPSYAPSGKILTPIPVFRWKRGQRLSQNLLDLQLPLYDKIMEKAPKSLTTMIVSGDVLIRANAPLQSIPEADVVCYGLWVDAQLARNHGVFVMRRDNPEALSYMLQKPSIDTLNKLAANHLYLMDIGVWMLSERALQVLMQKSTNEDGTIRFYDLYSEFGTALGLNPSKPDSEVSSLSVAILPLPGGEFHHYGTSREIISSTLAIQDSVIDQRAIMHHAAKPHPAIFVQNSETHIPFTIDNSEIWIENSHISTNWAVTQRNIVTGVPKNDWTIKLRPGMCIDIVPIGETQYAIRPYDFIEPHPQWLLSRCGIPSCDDPQSQAHIYPITESIDDAGRVLSWMLEGNSEECERLYLSCNKISAEEISAKANLSRLQKQREEYRSRNWMLLANNHERSVFYQLNLQDAAEEFKRFNLPAPAPLQESESRMKLIADAMFRSRLTGDISYEERAFQLMRDGLAQTTNSTQQPHLNVYSDQIVWSRSPVRIDLAGGWTDTPPYSLMEGGNVVNIAIELNGQPPLQVYIKPSPKYEITLRSIDLGACEVVTSFEELHLFNKVGSPFSIPKAALVLAGFHPDFSSTRYNSLQEALMAFGSGIEMTMLSAIPAGSGLGTSSILASTVLGAVNEFCGLGWDKYEISNRTLVLEQLLTTGGGWQDQYGGVLHGVKLLQTQAGWQQQPLVRWLPDTLFTSPEYSRLHLLYYTGITRTAKHILAEIVRGMFLNSTFHLELLAEMKSHALDLYDAIQRNDIGLMGKLVRKTWEQNMALDAGTNPDTIQAITEQIDDLCLGYKLPGAGGGGYLYMIAKDEEAAARIRSILTINAPNNKARFVDLSLSTHGLEISKS